MWVARLVSLAIIYFADSRFKGIRHTLESEFRTRVMLESMPA